MTSVVTELDDDPSYVLPRMEERLAGIQREIARLQLEEQEVFQAIREQRRVITGKCKIHALPDEIILLVFYLLVEDYEEQLQETARRYPWITAAVSTRWRRICLDDPRLWRHFHFEPPSAFEFYHKKCIDELDTPAILRTFLQLERSGATPLVVDMSTLCHCAGQITKYRAVAAQCHRWEVALFDCSLTKMGTSNMDLILQFLPQGTRFPLLRRLEWNAESLHAEDRAALPFVDYDSLRKLVSVSIYENQWDLSSGAAIPWKQLTYLYLEGYRGSEHHLLTTLSQCQNLLHLDLNVRNPPHPRLIENIPGAKFGPVTLARLEQFECHMSGHFEATNPITYLVLPGLRSLHSNKLPTMLDLLQRSSCSKSLTSLSISLHEAINLTAEVIMLLRMCPFLNSLTLKDYWHSRHQKTEADAGNSIVQGLVLNEAPASVCPRLTHLELWCLNVDPSILIRVVDSRTRRDGGRDMAGLQRLYWTLPKGFRPSEDEEIQLYRTLFEQKYSATGLDLMIDGYMEVRWPVSSSET